MCSMVIWVVEFLTRISKIENRYTVESHNSGQVGRPEIVPYCGIFPYFASSQNLRKKDFFFVQRKLNIVVLFTNWYVEKYTLIPTGCPQIYHVQSSLFWLRLRGIVLTHFDSFCGVGNPWRCDNEPRSWLEYHLSTISISIFGSDINPISDQP